MEIVCYKTLWNNYKMQGHFPRSITNVALRLVVRKTIYNHIKKQETSEFLYFLKFDLFIAYSEDTNFTSFTCEDIDVVIDTTQTIISNSIKMAAALCVCWFLKP